MITMVSQMIDQIVIEKLRVCVLDKQRGGNFDSAPGGNPMRRSRRFAHQVPVLALLIVSVFSLLMAAGLFAFSGNPAAPAGNIAVEPGVEIIGESPVPLAPAGTEGSFAILGAALLAVLAFVCIWFMVFRPGGKKEKENCETE